LLAEMIWKASIRHGVGVSAGVSVGVGVSVGEQQCCVNSMIAHRAAIAPKITAIALNILLSRANRLVERSLRSLCVDWSRFVTY
jgi:hypothetical protein